MKSQMRGFVENLSRKLKFQNPDKNKRYCTWRPKRRYATPDYWNALFRGMVRGQSYERWYSSQQYL